jgi:predicted outer membrane repeat protein
MIINLIKKSLLSIIILTTISSQLFAQSGSKTIYVDSSAIGFNDGSTWENAFIILDSAIVAAHRDLTIDSILVATGTYYPNNIPPTSNFDISTRDRSFYFFRDQLSVLGGYPNGGGIRDHLKNKTILSGDIGEKGFAIDNVYRILLIMGNTSDTLNHSLIIDGFTIQYAYGNNSNVLNVNSINLRRDFGCGMYNYFASPTISHITFINNHANTGASMFNNSSSPKIENDSFLNNYAFEGGGIYNYKSAPPIDNCVFMFNEAHDGGGLYNSTYSSPSVVKCDFSNNKGNGGAGIFNYNHSSPYLTNIIFKDNEVRFGGGGLYNVDDCSPTCNRLTFINNVSSHGGGAIYNLNNSSPVLNDVNIFENSAKFGGGMYNINKCSPIINNSNFNNNTAENGGGVYNTNYSSPTLNNVKIIENIAIYGGGIFNTYYCSPIINNSNISTNKANHGGGLYNLNSSAPKIDNSNFKNNIAESGAAIYNVASPPRISNSNIDSNIATYYGGGIFNNSSSYPDLTNVDIRNNKAEKGGGIYNYDRCTPRFTDVSFKENFAHLGGAIYNENQCNSFLTNVTFNLNKAQYDGGAVYNYNRSGQVFKNVIFHKNEALNNGGAVYNQSECNGIYDSVFFEENIAFNNGGSVYNLNMCNPTFSNTIFNKNEAKNGGAVYNLDNCSPIFNNTTFNSNRAESGGGLYNYINSNPNFNSCTFKNNTSSKFGGGVYNEINVTSKYKNVSFINNKAEEDGGAIYNLDNSSPTFEQVVFSGNEASQGGAVFNIDNSSPTFNNSIISGNSGFVGSAIYNIQQCHPIINNTTIAGNFSILNGENGAVFISEKSAPKIYNSIIYGNSASISSGSSDSKSDIQFSLIEGLFETENGNIPSADPLFNDTANGYRNAPFTDGDYRLKFCSPAINKGNIKLMVSDTLLDLANNIRVIDTLVDIGAYEKQSNSNDFKQNVTLSSKLNNGEVLIPTCEDDNGWTWYYSKTNIDSLSFAIKWNSDNEDAKNAAELILNIDTGIYTSINSLADSAIALLPRNWNLNFGSNKLNSPISIRFFYNIGDTNILKNKLDTLTRLNTTNLLWFKTNEITYEPLNINYYNLKPDDYNFLTPKHLIFNGINCVQFDSIQTSGGGTALISTIDKNHPFAKYINAFNATAVDNNKALLEWLVTPNATSKVIIEHSTDTINWNVLDTILSEKSKINYQNWDLKPYHGINYYRLKVFDLHGNRQYTTIKSVEFDYSQDNAIHIYPNPNKGSFTVDCKGIANATLTIYDILGRLQFQAPVQEGKNNFMTEALAKGVYLIEVKNDHTKFNEKLIIE